MKFTNANDKINSMAHAIKRMNTRELRHTFDKVLLDVSQGKIVVVEQNGHSSIALIPVRTEKQIHIYNTQTHPETHFGKLTSLRTAGTLRVYVTSRIRFLSRARSHSHSP